MTDLAPAEAPASVQVPIPNSNTPTPSPEPKADAPPSADASASEQPKAPTEPEATQDAKPDERPKGNRVQERIDQLTAQRRAAEARAAIAERRLAELMQPVNPPDPNDYDAHNAHQIETVLRKQKAEDLHAEIQAAARESFVARKSAYEAKIAVAEERIPDIQKSRAVFYQMPFSSEAADVVAESPKAAEITHYLANNFDEAERILALPAHKQAIEFARLEARVAPAPQARRVSQAPAPPPTIGGGAPSAAKSPNDMSVAELQAILYPGRKR